MAIPSPSHPWSPWRPVAAIGWLGFGVLLVGAWCLFAYAANASYRHADACALRWTSTKTIGDSVRVAGDCGMPPKPHGGVFDPDSGVLSKRHP